MNIAGKQMDKEWLWLWCFPVSSLSGLSTLLASSEHLSFRDPATIRKVVSVLLNAGLCGTAIAYLLVYYGQNDPAIIVVTSIMSGLGGNGILDIVVTAYKKGLVGFIAKLIRSMMDEDDAPRS